MFFNKIYNSISTIFDLCTLRRNQFFYILIPLILLSITVQSTAYFGVNIENSLKPSETNSMFQTENNLTSNLFIIGSVPLEIWNAHLNFSSYFLGLINSSFLKTGINNSFIKSNNFYPYIHTQIIGNPNPFYIIESDEIIHYYLQLSNSNLSIDAKNESLLVFNNLNSSQLPTSIRLSNFTLSITKNISYSTFFNEKNPFSTVIQFFGISKLLAIVSSNTFYQLIKSNLVNEVLLNSFLKLNTNGLYQLLYNTNYNGIFKKYGTVLSNIGTNQGFTIQFFQPDDLINIQNNFQTLVTNATIIWLAVSIFLVLPVVLLTKFVISNSFRKFRKIYDTFMLKGTNVLIQMIYFTLELISLFFVQLLFSSFIVYIIDNYFSPFGLENTNFNPIFSILFLQVNIILFLVITIFYIASSKNMAQFFYNPYIGLESKKIEGHIDHPKRFRLRFLIEIIGLLILLALLYNFNYNSNLKLFSFGCFIVLFSILFPDILIVLYILLYRLVDFFAFKINFKILGIKSLLLNIRFPRIIRRIRLLFFFLLILSTFFAFFSTYENNDILNSNYQSGAPIVVSSPVNNPRIVQNLTKMNGGSGVSVTALLYNNYLGSESSILPESFNVLALNSSTYPSLNNLNNPGFELSSSPNILLSRLQSNRTILGTKDFLESRNLNINDTITIIITKNGIEKAISLTIVGSFELWPGFIKLPQNQYFTKSAIIMSLATLQNITNINSLSPTYYYNINPSKTFNYPKLFNSVTSFGTLFYSQSQAQESFNQFIYRPALFAIIFFTLIIFFRSIYEVDRDTSEIIEDFTIPKALGLSNKDIRIMLIFEILIELFIIVFGSILGALFGFVLVINMNIFNDFPIIYSFDNNLVMELIGIFSILTVLELTAAKLFSNKKKITESLTIED